MVPTLENKSNRNDKKYNRVFSKLMILAIFLLY